MNKTETPGSQRAQEARCTVTVEAGLWIIIALIALGLRVFSLGAAPLNASEAREAMLAWRAVEGQGMPIGNYSPLLFSVNGLLFALFGASDALARLVPATAGAGLALTPLLFRERLGRWGSLAAGAYLAISPTALFASRQVDGAAVAALGVTLFLGGLVRFWDSERRSWLILAAGGLSLALTSSSSAYGLLIPLGLAYLITFYVSRLTFHASRFTFHASRFTFHVSRSTVALAFFLVTFALSTALGWNPSGLGAVGDLAVQWFARFGPASSPAPSPITLLVAYEPFSLVFGVIGLILGTSSRRGRSPSAGHYLPFALWVGLALLLLIVMPGRERLDLLWLVLPLATLAGGAVEWLAMHPRMHSRRPYGLIGMVYALVVLVLWGYLYLLLARYAVRGEAAHLTLALVVLIMQLILMLSFAWTIDGAEALRGFAAGTGIALLALTFSAGWGVAHVRPSDPREALVRQPTAAGVRDLVQTLRELSWRETGLPTTLPFTYQAAPDSVLSWYLRDFDAAHRVDRLGGPGTDEAGPVLVKPGRELTLGGEAEYVGQDFAIGRHWELRELNCQLWPPRCSEAVGWFLFRDTPALPEADQWATLWLKKGWVEE